MRKVFVSGGFGLLHPGHIKFFRDARALGDYLIVSFACDKEMMKFKRRKPVLSEAQRRVMLEAVRWVDEVVMGDISDKDPSNPIFDFAKEFKRLKPNLLVTTVDDPFAEQKLHFAKANGADFMTLPKDVFSGCQSISTTEMRGKIVEDEQDGVS